jgi:hypothetical protein
VFRALPGKAVIVVPKVVSNTEFPAESRFRDASESTVPGGSYQLPLQQGGAYIPLFPLPFISGLPRETTAIINRTIAMKLFPIFIVDIHMHTF